MLRDLLVHVEVLREGEAGSRAGPPGHRCVWGSADASSGYSQWLKVQRCFDAVKAFEEEHCVRFSHVVRSRPDLQSVGPQPLPPISALPNDTISVQTKEARKVDDRFAVVPRALADVYFGAVGSYFTCRTCKYYHDHCWPHSRLKKGRAFCNRSKHALAALRGSRKASQRQDHHVSSECLLGSWLFDHGVRATPGPERFEDKWLVAVVDRACNRAIVPIHRRRSSRRASAAKLFTAGARRGARRRLLDRRTHMFRIARVWRLEAGMRQKWLGGRFRIKRPQI